MKEKDIDGFKATELIFSGVITSKDISNGILYDESKDIEIEILEYKDNNLLIHLLNSLTLNNLLLIE